jgi:hypothetical protein
MTQNETPTSFNVAPQVPLRDHRAAAEFRRVHVDTLGELQYF